MEKKKSRKILPKQNMTELPVPSETDEVDALRPDSSQQVSLFETGSLHVNGVIAIALFIAAGFAEIGGGWLVWQTFRERRPWWYAVAGALVLFLYGVIPTFQPLDNFGRVYAVYGGFFVVLSYLWGWMVDGMRPDTVDWVCCGVVMVAVLIAFFWPR